MNEREFCYWLQSAFELADIKSFDEKQTKAIKEHLQLVFKKVTESSATITIDPNQLQPGGIVSNPPIAWPYDVTCEKLDGNTYPSCSDDDFGFGHMHVVGT